MLQTSASAAPLDMAVTLGHGECAVALVRAGSAPNAGKAHLVSPLARSVGRGERDWGFMLVEAGADPAFPEGKGQIPLCLAASKGDAPLFKEYARTAPS